jgi:chemotaxis protein CheX
MLIATEVMDQFSSCLSETLSMMTGLEIEPGRPFEKPEDLDGGDISSVIGFGGDQVTGCLVFHFPLQAALALYEAMMGENPGELNAEVRDGIGELANIVLGSAKTAFSHRELDFQISIPTVVIGQGHRVRLQSNLPVMVIPFAVEDRPCTLEVAVLFGDN